MARSKQPRPTSIERRRFLQHGAIVGAAALMAPVAGAQQTPPPETSRPPPLEDDVLTTDSAGSDFMVDVIKSLGFEYICANPGSSFRGLHESVINYGGNEKPPSSSPAATKNS